MNTLLTPLLARLTSATGIDFTLISPDTIELSAGDAFKLAAVVDLAARAADVMGCFGNLRETIALGSEVFPAPQAEPTRVDLNLGPWTLVSEPSTRVKRYVQLDDTVMGLSRERVAKDLADKRTMAEQEKLAEAGRKSWVTRRANAAKKGGRK